MRVMERPRHVAAVVRHRITMPDSRREGASDWVQLGIDVSAIALLGAGLLAALLGR